MVTGQTVFRPHDSCNKSVTDQSLLQIRDAVDHRIAPIVVIVRTINILFFQVSSFLLSAAPPVLRGPATASLKKFSFATRSTVSPYVHTVTVNP